MAEIAELSKTIDLRIKEKKELFDSIRYGRNHIKDKLEKKSIHNQDETSKSPVQIKSKEEIYNELKDRFRFAWKSSCPGYSSSEFSHIPVLKGKILSTWDRERALMPERSYKAPKGFRGMKVTNVPTEFGEPSEKLLPKLYKAHLDGVKKDYNDRVMRPSKYGPIKEDIIMSNLFNREQERGWKKLNTVQIKEFGFNKPKTQRDLQKKTMRSSFEGTMKMD